MPTSNLYLVILIIIFSPLIGSLAKQLYDFFTLSQKVRNGASLLDLLNKITNREFQIWTAEHLSTLGFSNILLSHKIDNNNDILCKKNDEQFYVFCLRKNNSENINKTDIENLLGLMISKQQNNGILFTTNKIDSDALKLKNDLLKPYKIDIVSIFDKNPNYRDYLLNSKTLKI